MKIDLSNSIAAEMDKVLQSDENKQIFSNSSMLEKLAFQKVSEQDAVTEIEMELDPSLRKTASCKDCECKEAKGSDCKCKCHDDKDTEKTTEKKSARNPVRDAFHSLLKISEVLDAAGFDKLAATSALLADRLIVEAKAKSSKKSDKKSDKKSKSDKGSSKKMDMKERMEKMRKMQKGKGKGSKDDKKSKKSSDPKKK